MQKIFNVNKITINDVIKNIKLSICIPTFPIKIHLENCLEKYLY